MYTYELDTSLLPKVWVTWASTKNKRFAKRFWFNCQTGIKTESPEPWMLYDGEANFNLRNRSGERYDVNCWRKDSEHIWVTAGKSLKFGYLKYHPDIDKLEFAIVYMDTSRKPGPRTWQYLGGRYFVDKNKVVTDVCGNVENRTFNAYDGHVYYNFKEFISCTTRCYTNSNYLNEFLKFYGQQSMTISSGRVINFSSNWSVWSWFVYKPISCASSKRKLIDTLNSIELSDSSDFSRRYPAVPSGNIYAGDLNNIVYFERVDDTWSVLRGFCRVYSSKDPLKEQWRLYINDSGKLQMLSNTPYGWMPTRIGTYHGYYFANKDTAIAKCNRIKYILKDYTDAPTQDIVPMLIRALQYPEVEQVIKLGHPEIVSRYNYSLTFRADMKHAFGGYYNEKEKNFLKKIGMTKQQLDAAVEYEKTNRVHGTGHISIMRNLFGHDLSHLDIASFKKYYKGFAEMHARTYNMDGWLTRNNIDRVRFYKNLIRLGEKNTSVYQLAGDTLRGYDRLNDDRKPRVDWMFDSFSDLVRAHNSIDELCRQQDAERRAYYAMAEAERRKQDEEKRVKLDKERVKYEYDDGEYVIRLPRNLTEIVDEGSIQRICIGGYTGTHSRGECTIFFLRLKAAPNTPFYAIEVRGNHVNQIHGYCNKWLGNNPEAIPTVMRWLRKHDIKCETGILTCTAQGYGRTGNYVELPKID
jgi:hypothetical protein